MPLKMRPTGLGHGVYKDNVDYGVFCGDWCIGRIYETRTGPADLQRGGRCLCDAGRMACGRSVTSGRPRTNASRRPMPRRNGQSTGSLAGRSRGGPQTYR